ncbi:MAG TPA: alpha/beta hydrolase [Gemmataceae bacterium]|jgi:acetyl esterase/lipase|nr:alpha/beta hydrolase [Gemmataceae bacterium]
MSMSFLIATLAACCMATPSNAIGRQSPDSTIDKDIVYSKVDGRELHLDLVRPTATGKPVPFILWLHGGGWRQGDRKDSHPAMQDMAKLGYAGGSVEYRLAPAHKFPSPLEDARQALAFLRKNAAKYNLDPDRIAVAGGSAGGHLSLMLGLAKPAGDKGPNGICGVIDISGPTDFRTWKIDKEADDLLKKSVGVNLDGLIADFVGTSDRQDRRMVEVSPITYVSKDNPAVLILHGTADGWVPFQQARVLNDALKQAGVKVKLVPFEGASHFAVWWSAQQKAKMHQQIVQFLEEVFKQR